MLNLSGKAKWWTPIFGTLGAIGIYLAAMWHNQIGWVTTGGPVLTPASATEYRVVQDYTATVSGVTVAIKAGFTYDGASIPRAAWSALGLEPFSGCLCRGALLHDALYAAELLPRETADAILHAAILADGCEPHKAQAIYRAVSDCGVIVWSRHTAESVVAARGLVSIRR